MYGVWLLLAEACNEVLLVTRAIIPMTSVHTQEDRKYKERVECANCTEKKPQGPGNTTGHSHRGNAERQCDIRTCS